MTCPIAMAAALCLLSSLQAQTQPQPTIPIEVDAAAHRHAISPLIYGVSFGTAATLAGLGATVNRSGGDSASTYNWQLKARNAGRDYFFESLPCTPDIFDQFGDNFVALSRSGGASPMLTIPMLGWSARLGPDRARLASFSIAKYGPQSASDTNGLHDAGSGIDLDGHSIQGNDPHDAAQPDTLANQALRLQRLVARWGTTSHGGVPFYLLDNEPSQWHLIHRDLQPTGLHATELAARTIAYSAMIKAVDPSARVVAPEEAGWASIKDSGFDQQQAAPVDRTTQTHGLDLLPWLLTQWKQAGHPVDIVSMHFYPQAGEYRDHSDDASPAMQLRRNRSTRLLWDSSYRDDSWIQENVALIPRLRAWVDRYYYPGTPIALTEYNWGGENTMNGATAQADLLGIFGREDLYLATRWAAPAVDSPTYLAMQLFRKPSAGQPGFGDISVQATTPDSDQVSAFAALRSTDRALTVIAINKQLDQAAPISLTLTHFAAAGTVEAIRLADSRLSTLPIQRFAHANLQATLPAQSVTLFILHPHAR